MLKEKNNLEGMTPSKFCEIIVIGLDPRTVRYFADWIANDQHLQCALLIKDKFGPNDTRIGAGKQSKAAAVHSSGTIVIADQVREQL